jgi:hypothetical protein
VSEHHRWVAVARVARSTSPCSPNRRPRRLLVANARLPINLGPRQRLFYSSSVSSDLWFGAVTTLAGAFLGGAISLALNRQQMKDARGQRAEEDLRIKQRRSADRRFDVYAAFFTPARAYRNALRPFAEKSASRPSVSELDELARAADSASSLVFLVLESEGTYKACDAIVRAIMRTQSVLYSDPHLTSGLWPELNNDMAQLLREFQVAVRDELEVNGVERSLVLSRRNPIERVAPERDADS